ncbi:MULTISPECIES: SDR family NAD(P)-dependent oxidoreductase [Sphingobium]|uniref:SDR family NAD(P)-dependent oxidoreductase n=1 Tax=Sphingobium TaxID=165695 RepID=UPI00301B4E53
MTVTRTAIIVGGANGIGKSVSERLAADGYRIMLADLDDVSAQNVVRALPGDGHQAFAIDVTQDTQVESLMDRVEQISPAAILVVVAGAIFVDPANVPNIAQFPTAIWNKTFALNITGTFFCVRKFASQRLVNPLSHTRIVTFASGSGQQAGDPTGVAYAATKAAVLGLTRVAAYELAAHNITVNALSPGAVGTPIFFEKTSEEARAALADGTPMGRFADPKEIAAGVSFLVSQDASYVTGTTLDINGGLHMH